VQVRERVDNLDFVVGKAVNELDFAIDFGQFHLVRAVAQELERGESVRHDKNRSR